MLARERVFAALDFRPPDVVPLRVFPAQGGLHEHGRKLLDLLRATGHDFGDFPGLALPEPPLPTDFDPDGSYHAFRTDAWGTTWEYRIPGIWGHPLKWPLAEWAALESYQAPPPPPAEGPEFDALRATWARLRERYYHMEWAGSIFEKLHSLRRFEDVLVDIAQDAPQINRLADLVVENVEGWVRRALALGADGIQFGDDFGTMTGPIVSPAHWRRFFKPRYHRLFAPRGRTSFFTSAGGSSGCSTTSPSSASRSSGRSSRSTTRTRSRESAPSGGSSSRSTPTAATSCSVARPRTSATTSCARSTPSTPARAAPGSTSRSTPASPGPTSRRSSRRRWS